MKPVMRITLAALVETGLPQGFGVRLVGGRKVYAEWGSMWRARSRHTHYVAGVPFAGDWAAHEKSRRYLPDDTPVDVVSLPDTQ